MKKVFPKLKINKNPRRIRDFNNYSELTRAKVLAAYLLFGFSHRSIDETILGQDSITSRGWPSMNILHCYGITGSHKKIFEKKELSDVLEFLISQNNNELINIINSLDILYKYDESGIELEENSIIRTKFNIDLKKSLKDSSEMRRLRLNTKGSEIPKKVETISTQFLRDPDVVAEVLERADGICENCNDQAPFIRKKDGTPYLEVHHIKMLAYGGEDTVKNAIALCPNCHKMMHYG